MNSILSNSKKTIYLLFFLFTIYFYSQVRIADNATNSSAPGSSAFIDASSNTDYNLTDNVGKGLLYPRTDLTLFSAFGGGPGYGIGNNYPYRYDGFMVYNTASTGFAGWAPQKGRYVVVFGIMIMHQILLMGEHGGPSVPIYAQPQFLL